MAMTVVMHIVGEDAILADMEDLPESGSTYVVLRNVRKKDGKPLPYGTEGATAFLYPWTRITSIETMGEIASSAAAGLNGQPHATTILGFFRDDEKRS